MFKKRIKYLFLSLLITLIIVLNSNNYLLSQELNSDLYLQKENSSITISNGKKEPQKLEAKKQKQEIEGLLKSAQSHIQKGQFYSAISQLEDILAFKPSTNKVLSLVYKRLGNAYSGIGEFDKAVSNYQNSLKQEKSLSTLNNLVKTLIEEKDYNNEIFKSAKQVNSSTRNINKFNIKEKENQHSTLNYARQAVLLSHEDANKFSLSAVIALLNWYDLTQNLNFQQLQNGRSILKSLPASRNLGFTMLNWSIIDQDNQLSWLEEALKIAQEKEDAYLHGYVSLEIASFYQKHKNLKLALEYAHKSQRNAQSEFAYDLLFRSQKLTGDIYQAFNDSQAAILAYKNAISSIETLNQDSLSINTEQRINFNSQIEPIYREALNLLLNSDNINKSKLIEAINISDKLRIAQLQNYFGDDCFEIQGNNTTNSGKIPDSTVLINSIILNNRVFFILQLPNGEIHYSQTKIDRDNIYSKADKWSKDLNNRTNWNFSENSRFFYNLIIKPFESILLSQETSQIIFVHDGILRNLPMAALFDGEKYLAQKWASVSSLGLKFTPPIYPEEENSNKLKVIAFGLENPTNGWTMLDNVPQEIKNILNILNGDAFLNTQFTFDNFKSKLRQEDYSILHLATHAYFGGAAETSFILAHDGQISALQLEDILTQSKEIPTLLVLSACETATGNDSSLLGLAGIAARSGVKSTIGSLWEVDDQYQSKIIEDFYSYWQEPTYNKATALQKVQIEQIKLLAHPQKWAVLNLIGNAS